MNDEWLSQKDEKLATEHVVLESFKNMVENSENKRSEVEFQLGNMNLKFTGIQSFKDNMIFLTENVCRKYVAKKNDHQIILALKNIRSQNPEFLDEIVKMFEANKCPLRKYLEKAY